MYFGRQSPSVSMIGVASLLATTPTMLGERNGRDSQKQTFFYWQAAITLDTYHLKIYISLTIALSMRAHSTYFAVLVTAVEVVVAGRLLGVVTVEVEGVEVDDAGGGGGLRTGVLTVLVLVVGVLGSEEVASPSPAETFLELFLELLLE